MATYTTTGHIYDSISYALGPASFITGAFKYQPFDKQGKRTKQKGGPKPVTGKWMPTIVDGKLQADGVIVQSDKPVIKKETLPHIKSASSKVTKKLLIDSLMYASPSPIPSAKTISESGNIWDGDCVVVTPQYQGYLFKYFPMKTRLVVSFCGSIVFVQDKINIEHTKLLCEEACAYIKNLKGLTWHKVDFVEWFKTRYDELLSGGVKK